MFNFIIVFFGTGVNCIVAIYYKMTFTRSKQQEQLGARGQDPEEELVGNGLGLIETNGATSDRNTSPVIPRGNARTDRMPTLGTPPLVPGTARYNHSMGPPMTNVGSPPIHDDVSSIMGSVQGTESSCGPSIRLSSIRRCDLQDSRRYLPQTVEEVYSDDFRLSDEIVKSNTNNVRRAVRNKIYPYMKFISGDRDQKQNFYYRPEKIEKDNNYGTGRMQYDFLASLHWAEHTSQVERAIRWNTFSGLVEKQLSINRSTNISQIKKGIVEGMDSDMF